MSDGFEKFLKAYFEAIEKEDVEFIKRVYNDWFESSGIMPKEQKEQFFKLIFGDLKQLLGGTLDRTEIIDEYYIAHMKSPEGEYSITFMKKDDSWVFFNERTNLAHFKNVYAINYDVKGESKLRMLFNGKRSPTLTDIEGGRQGFISMINSALKVGENELTLQSVDGKPLEVLLLISSGKIGEIIDSSQGDVLNWQGTVKEPVALKFKAD